MLSSSGFEVNIQGNQVIFFIKGVWDFYTPKKILKNYENEAKKHNSIILDFSQIKKIDLISITFLFLNAKVEEYRNASDIVKLAIADFNKLYMPSKDANPKQQNILISICGAFRNRIYSFIRDFVDFLNFFGLMLFCIYLSILEPKRFRWKSFLYHLNEAGFRALPVALLTAFIVGGAITLQGAIQLEAMGAPLLSVDMTAKLSLREMGPFVLALVLAGRSASSFTAQIGVMNITEESNAMRVMNFNLMDFLVVPRFLALVVVMPLMVFLADAASIFAGMIAIKSQLGVSFLQYAERFYETVGWNNFLVGIIKAPFFGGAIALVGCFRGLQVRGDTEQVGKFTTISVVNALFWIIFINAIFSIIFTRLDM
ncbi:MULTISPECIES: MlaE family lipid ABC transporter permease subunit [unclassified Helicobacter]|uniref:MlaE family lipid ABC transporter permease subunit n=1 Tax=unclassified Helicobacter TaxID=2593540 RepID=UPI001F43EF6A|nr:MULTISPECIES: MlaE family lipid ABC transporter permease subunit [unclassified Helicobacter]